MEATMRGSTVTVAFVMALRTADWLRSRHRHKSLGIDAALGNTALEEKEVCKICGETRTTERVYQIGSVTYTMQASESGDMRRPGTGNQSASVPDNRAK
jgi:hypothetical protein